MPYHLLSETPLANVAATWQLAKDFATQLQAGQVIYLEGELGAGKTSFVQGLITALGFTGAVTSPTYTLVESYPLTDFALFHFDLYRLRHPEELEFIGIEEYFRQDTVCLIEWPERGLPYLPAADMRIELLYEGEKRRCRIWRCD